MESERQILQWITEGLPSDETSHQNAIILKQVKNIMITFCNQYNFIKICVNTYVFFLID